MQNDHPTPSARCEPPAAFHLYRADCIGNPRNCLYPHEVTVGDGESLRLAVRLDYAAAAYRNSCRSRENYLCSDCLAMDCDNDHSDSPADWADPESIRSRLPEVTMGFHFSRHHQKEKEGRGPRPRFHVFFRIEPMTDPDAYRALKKQVSRLFPVFDANALDAARFFFGTENPEVLFYPGTCTLNDALKKQADSFTALPDLPPVIPEGSRNATLSHFAGRILKRLGLSEEARQAFLEKAALCDPPLNPQELDTVWRSAVQFYQTKVLPQPDYVPPASYAGNPADIPVEPIPFGRYTAPPFPVDVLPPEIGDYVRAVAESTQTPIDMAGTAALSVLSVCLQGKYRIQGISDWTEPLNTYALVIAPPSERKSAVLNMMLRPLSTYETRYNRLHASAVESSRMRRRILERRQRAVEEKLAKGKGDPAELDRIAGEIAGFREEMPLQLYVDDVTTEKLISVLAANRGTAALISSESGIFDTLAGIYSRNVNIDVMLKGYSGDTIRVERIGRSSESVPHPALTVFLMAQPNIVSEVLGNPGFRGRGLTARFLYCMPFSQVGARKIRTLPIPEETADRYDRKIFSLLEDKMPEKPRQLLLTDEARSRFEAFAGELEPRLSAEYAAIADWAGKLAGNTLRFAGLLWLAGRTSLREPGDAPDPLTVDAPTMEKAVRLSRYYLDHAQAAFDVLPDSSLYGKADRILSMIREKNFSEFDRRTAMRCCPTFKKVTDIQPVLDFLEDCGYIFQLPSASAAPTGRPPLPKYTVNPKTMEGVLS